MKAIKPRLKILLISTIVFAFAPIVKGQHTLPFSDSFNTSLSTQWNSTQANGSGWELGNITYNSAGYDNNVSEHTGDGGNYAWIDFSETDDSTILESPKFRVTYNTNIQLVFWQFSYYSINSVYANWLYIEAFNGISWDKVDSIQQNDPTWVCHTCDLSAYKFNIDSLQFRFRAESGGTTSDYYNDILLDDIYLYEPSINDLTMIEWATPNTGTSTSNSMPISVSLKNVGSVAQNGFDLKYSIDGGATIISETYNGIIQPNDTLTYTFSQNANMPTPGYYNVQAIVTNNGDTDPANDTIFAKPYISHGLAGIYTIGLDITDDFASFNEAVFILSTCGITGPVIINIDSGIYYEQVSIPYISGSSAINTITFQSASGNANDVILEHNTANSYSYAFELKGAKYVTINGITINHSSSFGYHSNSRAVSLKNGAKFNTIKNNIINMPIASNSINTHEACIGLYGKNVDSNLVYGNILYGGHYGVYLVGHNNTSWAYHNIIDSNECTHNHSYGIYNLYQYGPQISRNYIHDIQNTQAYGIYNEYIFSGFKIEKNKIQLNGISVVYGIYIKYGNDVNRRKDVVKSFVQNNFISINTIPSSNSGIYTYYSDNILYAHNTINITGLATGSRCVHQEASQHTNRKGEKWYNNIFANNALGYAVYLDDGVTVDSLNNNCYYTNGVNLAHYGSNKPTLQDFQIATSQDQNSVSKDVTFFSNTNLHINDVDLDSAAMPLSYVAEDIDGDIRTTSPDIGADEYNLINNDASITDIEDLWGKCAGNNIDVYVTVSNFGFDTLTTGNIYWEINGVAQFPYSFTGNIPTNSSADYLIGSTTLIANTQYNVKAWTANPNGFIDVNNNNDTLIETGFYTSLSSGTYTIGPDSTYDFQSFNDAENELKFRGVCGPVVFEVADGIYNEQLHLDFIKGSSPVNTITFKSASGNSASVELISATTDAYTISLDGCENIIIKQMTITSTNYSFAVAIELRNEACYNLIDSNTINGLGPSTYCRTIHSINDGANEFNTISNNAIVGGVFGVYFKGVGPDNTETGNKFINNNIYNQSSNGIYIENQDSAEIINNYVHNLTHYNTYAIYMKYCKNGCKILNNKIILNESENRGILVDYCNYYLYTSANDTNNIIANNMISILGTYGDHIGIYSYNNDKTDFYYNSVYIKEGGNLSRAFYYTNTPNNTTGVKAKNNIFINVDAYAAYFNNTNGINELDNNMYYGDTNGTSFVFWDSINKPTIAELQTASSMDIHSTQENAYFFSETDLHKSYLSPNDGGTPIAGFTLDFDGETRKATNPDRGIDEWDRTANDIYVYEILKPIDDLCGDIYDEVIAVVYNLGTNTQTSIPINISVNGPNGSFNLSNTISSIAPGQKDTVFVGYINTLTSGHYRLKVYSNLISDVYNANDTAEISFDIAPAYPVPFLEDFESSLYPWDLNETSIGQGPTYLNYHNQLFKRLHSYNNYGNAYMQGKIGTIPPNAYLMFDYNIFNYSTHYPTTLNGDSIQLMISTDCNHTKTPIYTIDQYSHNTTLGIKTISVSLSAYEGVDIGIGFEMTWANSGDYWVELDNIIIAVGPDIDLGPDTSICPNDSITLDAGSSLTQNYLYSWINQLNGDTLGISQTLYVDTTMNIVLFVENESNIMATDTINIDLSSPSVYLGIDTTICIYNSITLDAGSGFASYLWSTGSGHTQQTVLIDNNFLSGTDTTLDVGVLVTDNFGCTANDTIEITFSQCTSIDEYDFFSSAKLYPNPTNEFINFEIDDYTVLDNELRILYLLDANGKQIKEQRIESNKTRISLENLADGIYFVKIANRVYKIMKM